MMRELMQRLIAHDREELTIQIKVKITGSLIEAEQTILDACNEVGRLATSHAIKKFDTDGSPIQVAWGKLTAKEPTPKCYEMPDAGFSSAPMMAVNSSEHAFFAVVVCGVNDDFGKLYNL